MQNFHGQQIDVIDMFNVFFTKIASFIGLQVVQKLFNRLIL